MKIQFDLTEDANEIICIVKAQQRFKKKSEAIEYIIKVYDQQNK